MQNTNTSGKTWYTDILNTLHAFFRKYDLPEDMAGELQAIVIEIARAQYRAGNKGGIAWLLKKQAEEARKAPQVTAASPMVYST